jgi:hypothetical protein
MPTTFRPAETAGERIYRAQMQRLAARASLDVINGTFYTLQYLIAEQDDEAS